MINQMITFLLTPFAFNIQINSASNCLQSLPVTTLYFLYSTFQVGDKLLDFCVTGVYFLLSSGIQVTADFGFHTEDHCHEVDLSHDKNKKGAKRSIYQQDIFTPP